LKALEQLAKTAIADEGLTASEIKLKRQLEKSANNRVYTLTGTVFIQLLQAAAARDRTRFSQLLDNSSVLPYEREKYYNEAVALIERREGVEYHHIVSQNENQGRGWSKNWTALAKEILSDAKIDIDSDANVIPLRGHEGPHPQLYHRRVYERLYAATLGPNGQTIIGASLRSAVTAELGLIAKACRRILRA
jgi:hypothetical protein